MSDCPRKAVRRKRLRQLRDAALVSAVCWMTAMSPSSSAEESGYDVSILTSMGVEELLNVRVTTVSKKTGSWWDAAAALYVITQEDIRRSGVTTIPDALRMVPGLQVARIDGSQWAITARGFHSRNANKLLVLIDGRSIYSPFSSGVFWESHDVLLEDVDRIEVIRGPGATLWGANAVNGVINIITKPAEQTQGTVVTAGAGTEERAFGSARYGGRIGERAFYRVYVKCGDRDNLVDSLGRATDDAFKAVQGGFRTDVILSDRDDLTLQGDYRGASAGYPIIYPVLTPPYNQFATPKASITGLNVVGRWTHFLSHRSDLSLQVYYDRLDRDDSVLVAERDIYDVDFRHRFPIGRRNDVVWGFGYRHITDSAEDTQTLVLKPNSAASYIANVFVQDDVVLVRYRLHATLGTKWEYNTFTGWEVQPNARLVWTPHHRHTVWTAISRAIRMPSRAERDVDINVVTFPPHDPLYNPSDWPALAKVSGSQDVTSEGLLATELGYRLLPHDDLSLDIAAFHHRYDHLRTGEPDSVFPTIRVQPVLHLVYPFHVTNNQRGNTYGVEVAADWMAAPWLRMRGAYWYLDFDLRYPEFDLVSLGDTLEATPRVDDPAADSPRHQAYLRASFDLPKNIELDLTGRFVGELRGTEFRSAVPRYVEFDARLGWSPNSRFSVSLVGQNLFRKRHTEFLPSIIMYTHTSSDVERGVYGAVTWRF